MLDNFRWAWLIVGLTLVFLLQPLVLQAEPLELDPGGYVAAGIDHFGPFYSEDGEPDTTSGVLRNAKLELELEWGDSGAGSGLVIGAFICGGRGDGTASGACEWRELAV